MPSSFAAQGILPRWARRCNPPAPPRNPARGTAPYCGGLRPLDERSGGCVPGGNAERLRRSPGLVVVVPVVVALVVVVFVPVVVALVVVPVVVVPVVGRVVSGLGPRDIRVISSRLGGFGVR